MGTVSRRIVGEFGERVHPPHPAVRPTPAAYVAANVEIDGKLASIKLLIDTGSDITTLGPEDALAILGWSYLEIDFTDPATRLDLTGVGSAGATIRDALVIFTDEAQQRIVVPVTLAIAEPDPRVPAAHGNWLMPSLLGRDVLQFFNLYLGYHPPSVVLEEASASS